MRAMYLRSVKSPVVHGGFVMRRPDELHRRRERLNHSDIYSQAVVEQDSDYQRDSFCVDTDEDIEFFTEETLQIPADDDGDDDDDNDTGGVRRRRHGNRNRIDDERSVWFRCIDTHLGVFFKDFFKDSFFVLKWNPVDNELDLVESVETDLWLWLVISE